MVERKVSMEIDKVTAVKEWPSLFTVAPPTVNKYSCFMVSLTITVFMRNFSRVVLSPHPPNKQPHYMLSPHPQSGWSGPFRLNRLFRKPRVLLPLLHCWLFLMVGNSLRLKWI